MKTYTEALAAFDEVITFLIEHKEFPDSYYNQLNSIKNKLAFAASVEQKAKSKK